MVTFLVVSSVSKIERITGLKTLAMAPNQTRLLQSNIEIPSLYKPGKRFFRIQSSPCSSKPIQVIIQA